MGTPEEEVADLRASIEGFSERHSVVNWLFISGHRMAVAGVLLSLTFVVLIAANFVIGPIVREDTSPLFYLFSALVGGNFTLITIVISVSQLVVSNQLGTPGQIEDQIEATNDFRGRIEDTSDIDVAPVTPAQFLQFLVESAAEMTMIVSQEAEGEEGPAWEELSDAVDQLAAHIGRVEAEIRESDVRIVSALAVTLDTNYSRDIHDLRALRTNFADEYNDKVLNCLDKLVVRLQQIDVGRQYMKALYMQSELSDLSRDLLYVGVPALLASVLMLRGFAVGFQTISPDVLFASVPIAVTISLAPLMVLFSYILRLTTVARRTIAITPFTMAMQEKERDLFK